MEINTGRFTADAKGDFVVLLIGMRINRLKGMLTLWPIGRAMPKMLQALDDHPELGCLGHHQWLGRTSILVQYWRDFESLERFARAKDLPHLDTWRKYYQLMGKSDDVGVWHELYQVKAGKHEAIYVNMPTFGLAKASSIVPVGQLGETAAARLGVPTTGKPADPGH
jgi:hypothetical protein